MTGLLSSLLRRAGQHAASVHHGPVYVFCVVTLVLFLVGIGLWPRPVTSYLAHVQIAQRGGPPISRLSTATAGKGTNWRDEIISVDTWKLIAQEFGLVDQPQQLAALQACTAAAVAEKRDGAAEITLGVWGEHETRTLAVAQRLAECLVAEYARRTQAGSDCAACDAAELTAGQCEAAMRLAQQSLEDFRQQHAAELSPPAPTPAPQPAAAAPAPSPQQRELAERLEALRAKRSQVLEVRTPAHPGAQELKLQIEQVEAELAALGEKDNSNSPEAAPSPAKEAPGKQATVGPPAEIAQELQRLTAVADAAARRHVEARAAERQAWQGRWSRPAASASISSPAQIVVRHRAAQPGKASIVLLGLAAIAIGLGVAWRSQVAAQPAALVSAAQVEGIGLPVVALLATRDGPAIPQPQISNPPWLAPLMLGCEIVLAALAALLVVVALSDWQIAAQAVWNPLAAYLRAWEQLWP